MDWTVLIGWVGVAFGISVNIPQALRIQRTKSAKDVSVWTYRILFVCVVCYLVRAIAIGEPIFIVSNAVAIVVCAWVLWLKYIYS